MTWKGHASVHLKSNQQDNRKRYTGKPGRPAYEIPSEQIERLRYMDFSWVKIADFLSVSERTLRNKRAELDISLKYSQITEMQLDVEVQTTLTENPNMGGEDTSRSSIISRNYGAKENVTQSIRTYRTRFLKNVLSLSYFTKNMRKN